MKTHEAANNPRLTLEDALRVPGAVIRVNWGETGETFSVNVAGFSVCAEDVGSALRSWGPIIIRTKSGRRYATDFRVAIELPPWDPVRNDFGPVDARVSANHFGMPAPKPEARQHANAIGDRVTVGEPYTFAVLKGIKDISPVEVVTFPLTGFMMEPDTSEEYQRLFRYCFPRDDTRPYFSLPVTQESAVSPIVSAGLIFNRVKEEFKKSNEPYQRALGNKALARFGM